MKCLIIAAGRGSRLSGKGDSKPLLPLKGIPLIHRVILTVMESVIKEFYIVTGYNGDKVEKSLTTFSSANGIDINFIHNTQWEKPNGISVHCAREKLHEPFFLLMSDHLFDPIIIKEMMAEGIEGGEVKLAVDKRIVDNPLVDLDDVTKVLVDKDMIIDIGKTIPKYNAFDTGIFLSTPKLFEALELSIEEGDSSLSGGILRMSCEKKARVFNIGERNWIDIDNEFFFNKAKRLFSF